MDQLLRVLPDLLRAAGGAEEFAEAAVMAAWKHAVGEGLRDHAVASRLYRKTLSVAVADSTWKKQLEAMSPQLLFRLNSLLGQRLVTFIEFRIDPNAVLTARKGSTEGARNDSEQTRAAIPFELASAASSIHDSELRKAFLGAASSCLRRLENNRSKTRSEI
jgi:predicted nucleic acid-binding Zn ribbon protein